jgi:hypothetical protein
MGIPVTRKINGNALIPYSCSNPVLLRGVACGLGVTASCAEQSARDAGTSALHCTVFDNDSVGQLNDSVSYAFNGFMQLRLCWRVNRQTQTNRTTS